MCAKRKKLLFFFLLLGLVGCGTTALLIARDAVGPTKTVMRPTVNQTRNVSGERNLSLQPEAQKLARLLGTRFSAAKSRSVSVGTLPVGSEQQSVQIIRKQREDGENVEVSIGSSSDPLIWDAGKGGFSSGRLASRTERELIERLVFDSPDQFVLMQLRGGRYYTVARGVRPMEAPDGYVGPLWTMVRVDDPEQDEAVRPESQWRLYYVNSLTGLIDRIESEVQGQRRVAEITAWTEQDGEKLPSQIVWTQQGQIIMQYRLTNFSRSQN
jgi:hypothetical protein